MLELLAPEHRVTLLTPSPRAGRAPAAAALPALPPLPANVEVVTYGPAGRSAGGGGRTGGEGPGASGGEDLTGGKVLSAPGGEDLTGGEGPGAPGGEDLTGGEGPGAPGGGLGAGWRTARGVLRAALRGLPLQSGLFFDADLRRRLRALAPRADLAVLQLVRLALHRDDLGGTPVLVDLVDDLALNFSRRAAIDRWWLRPALAVEARLLARAQRRLARSAAGVLVVCERDRREVAARLPAAVAARVRIAGLAVEAGGAVARAAVPPEPVGPESTGRRSRLVFTGNLGYFVNADAISWWLREVWPALAAGRPDLELVVAGERPGRRLRQAVAAAAKAAAAARALGAAGAAGVAGAAGAAGVVGAHGGAVKLVESPPDLRRLLDGAAAALAPMRCGSGVPLKVLEAWARGVPVVASPWAAAGTTGVPGEDLLVAESPRQWVEALDRLLVDPGERRRLAANGRRRLEADYSRGLVKRQLLAAVAAACR